MILKSLKWNSEERHESALQMLRELRAIENLLFPVQNTSKTRKNRSLPTAILGSNYLTKLKFMILFFEQIKRKESTISGRIVSKDLHEKYEELYAKINQIDLLYEDNEEIEFIDTLLQYKNRNSIPIKLIDCPDKIYSQLIDSEETMGWDIFKPKMGIILVLDFNTLSDPDTAAIEIQKTQSFISNLQQNLREKGIAKQNRKLKTPIIIVTISEGPVDSQANDASRHIEHLSDFIKRDFPNTQIFQLTTQKPEKFTSPFETLIETIHPSWLKRNYKFIGLTLIILSAIIFSGTLYSWNKKIGYSVRSTNRLTS